MSLIKKLAKHSSHYFMGEVLVLGASLISFPIFTRLFSVEEYGTLSIITITFSLGCLISSLGLRPSVVRFYSEYNAQENKSNIFALYSTLFRLTIIAGSLVTGLIILYSFIKTSFLPISQLKLLRIGAALVLIRAIFKLALNFIRAEQKTIQYNIIYVLQQYVTLGLALTLVVVFHMGLLGLITGQLFVEGLFVFGIIVVLYRQQKLNILNYSVDIAKRSLNYGLPLIVLNFSSIIVTSGDRYIINWLLGLGSVGIYSVGYNLSNYVGMLIQTPLNTAITPIYMELWEKKGREETQIFLSKISNYYLMVAIPIVLGICAVGQDIVTLVASKKYSNSFVIIPLITGSIFLSGFNYICSAGLFLAKKTKLYGMLILGVAVINILLNICMIPFMGIFGAAIATLISYIIHYFFVRKVSFKYCRISHNYFSMLKYLFSAFVMYFIVNNFNVSNNLIRISLKVISGCAVYAALIYLFDEEIREILKIQFKKYTRKK